ncbi:hypothetical protein DFJ73DRAFT_795925 [Zopfochytrium polystomum]|nr:hypothetical protein DFJ73DRAFT_795925 [Zopfochytrium polystomum]
MSKAPPQVQPQPSATTATSTTPAPPPPPPPRRRRHRPVPRLCRFGHVRTLPPRRKLRALLLLLRNNNTPTTTITPAPYYDDYDNNDDRLTRLPTEILLEICAALAASVHGVVAMLRLAATCRTLRALLRDDGEVWTLVAKSLDMPVPPPGFLTVRQVLTLITTVGCQSCGADYRGKVFWDFGVRCCRNCIKLHTISQPALIKLRVPYDSYGFLPYGFVTPGQQLGVYQRRYWKADIIECSKGGGGPLSHHHHHHHHLQDPYHFYRRRVEWAKRMPVWVRSRWNKRRAEEDARDRAARERDLVRRLLRAAQDERDERGYARWRRVLMLLEATTTTRTTTTTRSVVAVESTAFRRWVGVGRPLTEREFRAFRRQVEDELGGGEGGGGGGEGSGCGAGGGGGGGGFGGGGVSRRLGPVAFPSF